MEHPETTLACHADHEVGALGLTPNSKNRVTGLEKALCNGMKHLIESIVADLS